MSNEVTGSIAAESIINAHAHPNAAFVKTKLATRALQAFPQLLTDLRTWDALATNLPGTPASDDLGLVTGTFGSAAPEVQTGDLKTAGATTRRARLIITVPDTYVAAGGLSIRCWAGMRTTVADVSATIDIEAYKINDDASGSIGSDICTTAAQSINSLNQAAKDFTLDPAAVAPGDRIDVRVSIAVNDAAGVTAVIGVLHNLSLLCDVKP